MWEIIAISVVVGSPILLPVCFAIGWKIKDMVFPYEYKPELVYTIKGEVLCADVKYARTLGDALAYERDQGYQQAQKDIQEAIGIEERPNDQ